MDLQSQETIKELADEHDHDELLVILGAPDEESAEIAAETIVVGDPTYAGPSSSAAFVAALSFRWSSALVRCTPELTADGV